MLYVLQPPQALCILFLEWRLEMDIFQLSNTFANILTLISLKLQHDGNTFVLFFADIEDR